MYTTGTGSEVYLACENAVPFSLSPGGGRRAALINPRCACTARVTVVVVCVCHLTSRAINPSTNNPSIQRQIYKGGKICRVFSETAAFESYGVKHERKSQYLYN